MSPSLPPIDLSKVPDFRIGKLTLRPSLLTVRAGEDEQVIQRLLMQFLIALIQAEGEVVSRQEFGVRCWNNPGVSIASLNRAASEVRKILDSAGSTVEIVSIRGVGYRLADPDREIRLTPDFLRRSDLSPQTPSPRSSGRTTFADRFGFAMPRWGVPLIAAVVVASVLSIAAVSRSNANITPDAYNSIAVLPIADRSGAGDLAFLAAGAAEAVREGLGLAADGEFRVSAMASTRSVDHAGMTDREVGEALGVDALLDGAIMEADGQPVLALTLLDPRNGRKLWTRDYEVSPESVDAVGHIVVADILKTLRRDADLPPRSPDPQIADAATTEILLRASTLFWLGDTASIAEADELYLQAIERSPEHAPGYAGLVWTSLASGHARHHARARIYLERAIELAPWHRDTLLAEQAFNDHLMAEGIKGDLLSRPDEPRREAVLDYGARLRTLVVQARYNEAEALVDEIVQLDPFGVDTNANIARVLNRRGKPAEALERLDAALRYNPTSLELRFWRVNALTEANEISAAATELLDMYELAPDDERTRYFLSVVLGYLGFMDEAIAVAPGKLQELTVMSANGQHARVEAMAAPLLMFDTPSVARARIYLLMHDLDAALPWLARLRKNEDTSNFYEHPHDYKPYLSRALKEAGRHEEAAAVDAEVLAEINREVANGDVSKVLHLPYRAMAAAAREDIDELCELLDVAAASGYILFGLDDVIFDHLRDHPEFATRYDEYLRLRQAQHDLLKNDGHIDRLRTLIASRGASAL